MPSSLVELVLISAGSCVGLLLAGLLYQKIGIAYDARRYPASGNWVTLAGRRVHIHCQGTGSPTVLLESGFPGSSLGWRPVQPEVAKFTRVCSYDRAGLGWSDPAPQPRSSLQMVQELQALLRQAGIPAPYVLVAHSFGGFIARLFAANYPSQVAGMVLIDPIHPIQWSQPTEQQARGMKRARIKCRGAAWLASLGLVRGLLFLISLGIVKIEPRGRLAPVKLLPASLRPILRALWSQPKPFNTLADQIAHLPESAAQVARTGSLGSMPLLVLSPSCGSTASQQQHDSLASLSTSGQHRAVADSGHWIQLEQPDLVVEAIHHVVGLARGSNAGNIHIS